MFINLQDIFAICKIFLILFLSCFAFYYPLVFLTKNRKISAGLSIPISLSFEIIIGYIFYTLGTIKQFPIYYLLLIIVLNIVFTILIRQKRIVIKEKVINLNYKNFFLMAMLAIPVLFTRFYDAIKNVAPGGIDTFAHIALLKQLDEIGYLGDTFYAPGFHLIMYPLTRFVDYADIYRFAGPAIGVIIVLSFWLIMRLILKNKIVLVVAVLLLCLPVFNQLILQMIYFFPSALTFTFLLGSIYLLLSPKELSTKLKLLLYLIISIGISFSVPYFFIEYIVAILALVIISIFASFRDPKYKKFLFIVFFIISCFGLFLSLGHVYLQTKLHKGGFPEIAIAKNQGGKIVSSINTDIDDAKTDNKLGLVAKNSFNVCAFLSKGLFAKKYLFPVCQTGKDVLNIKNIREPAGLLSVGAYLWIVVSLLMLFYGIKRRDQKKVVFAVFSLVYGISTQTGILEMSYYRGRSGWYLLFLSILGISSIIDELPLKKISKPVCFFSILLYLLAFTSPPVFYRAYFTEPFLVAYNAIKENPQDKLVFITNQKNLTLLSDNVSVLNLQKTSLNQISSKEKAFVVLDKKFFQKDPVLSQQALSIDKGYKQFSSQQKLQQKIQENTNSEIKSSLEFSNYAIYWENDNIEVYQLKKE
ncbi:MAG: hypothetical protein WC536_01645 [Patescibacteria group bacterium]